MNHEPQLIAATAPTNAVHMRSCGDTSAQWISKYGDINAVARAAREALAACAFFSCSFAAVSVPAAGAVEFRLSNRLSQLRKKGRSFVPQKCMKKALPAKCMEARRRMAHLGMVALSKTMVRRSAITTVLTQKKTRRAAKRIRTMQERRKRGQSERPKSAGKAYQLGRRTRRKTVADKTGKIVKKSEKARTPKYTTQCRAAATEEEEAAGTRRNKKESTKFVKDSASEKGVRQSGGICKEPP